MTGISDKRSGAVARLHAFDNTLCIISFHPKTSSFQEKFITRAKLVCSLIAATTCHLDLCTVLLPARFEELSGGWIILGIANIVSSQWTPVQDWPMESSIPVEHLGKPQSWSCCCQRGPMRRRNHHRDPAPCAPNPRGGGSGGEREGDSGGLREWRGRGRRELFFESELLSVGCLCYSACWKDLLWRMNHCVVKAQDLWKQHFVFCSPRDVRSVAAASSREEKMFSWLRHERSPGEPNRIPAFATDFLCDISHISHVVVNCGFLGAWYL